MKKTLTTATTLLLFLAGSVPAAPARPRMKVPSPAPAFMCPLLGTAGTGKGDTVSLKDLLAKDQVVVMSFFHTQCIPCRTEIPKLTQIVAGRTGVIAYLVFVGGEDEETVRGFLKQYGFTLPVLMDRNGYRVGERYKVVQDDIAHVPQIMVISKNGILMRAWSGFSAKQEAELPGLLDELMAEAKQAPPAADTITILFTNNTNGLTGPAPSIDVGGLAKRMTLIKRERAAAPASLLVEAGDFFPTSPDEARTRKVVAAYRLMGYDAVTIGEAEFVNGLKYLRGLVDLKILPWVSSNLKICEKEVCIDLVRNRAVFTLGKRKVAVIGYMHPDAVGFTPEERFKDGAHYIKFTDPRPLIKGFVEQFRKEADLLVVLSHAGVEEDRRLAQEVPGLDVIVGAHSQTFMTDPGREGDTVIVQAAADGQYLGKLVLKFGENGKPAIDAYELIPLTKNVPDDPDVAAAVASRPRAAKAE